MDDDTAMRPSVALVGSFRQHYEAICGAKAIFDSHGVEVTTPLGSPVLDPGQDFVRFATDCMDLSDPHVQTVALHRIFRARAVYVVAVGGYVGRTTAYEVGRATQAGRPIYFSERPLDLPIHVPGEHVVEPDELARRILESREIASVHASEDEHALLERRLLTGDYSYE
ncbi:hypothetical protein [Microbacterium binotii]|uniref:hypothetical protein n=1 Tax=Microbacterium binotii TaxID=462710 RepID=UPI001F1EF147|nr:hypothetical protein [Microbacterium binotii]UIN30523.1 hypothetical protein LXM64_15475 [Microbacterium binotii]